MNRLPYTSNVTVFGVVNHQQLPTKLNVTEALTLLLSDNHKSAKSAAKTTQHIRIMSCFPVHFDGEPIPHHHKHRASELLVTSRGHIG